VVFDRSIPAFVGAEFAEAAAEARSVLEMPHVDRFVCHPGGAKVVAALERALDLPTETLDAERAVLRNHGNMSAPTVLFVLKHLLATPRKGSFMACALGPGFTASFVPILAGPA